MQLVLLYERVQIKIVVVVETNTPTVYTFCLPILILKPVTPFTWWKIAEKRNYFSFYPCQIYRILFSKIPCENSQIVSKKNCSFSVVCCFCLCCFCFAEYIYLFEVDHLGQRYPSFVKTTFRIRPLKLIPLKANLSSCYLDRIPIFFCMFL